MKVSVIIPTYNRAHYICQAIDSVLQQTMNDIEIIVVDDGSTDNTREILKQYKEKITYIYTENSGPAHARNAGMKIAHGEYISFLDSDDLYYPYKTELQANFLDKYQDIGMVYTEFSAFDDDGYWDEYHLKNFHKAAFMNDNISLDDIFTEKLELGDTFIDQQLKKNAIIYIGNIFNAYFNNQIVATATIMFRRQILEVVGLQDECAGLFHDYEFNLRITKYCKVAFITLPTYKYRYHQHQISINKNKIKTMQILIRKQTDLLEIAKKHGLKDHNFYTQNRKVVNKRLAGLKKALAIPLMVKGNDKKKARMLLNECKFHESPERCLWLITFTPFIARRLLIKLYSIFKKV